MKLILSTKDIEDIENFLQELFQKEREDFEEVMEEEIAQRGRRSPFPEDYQDYAGATELERLQIESHSK